MVGGIFLAADPVRRDKYRASNPNGARRGHPNGTGPQRIGLLKPASQRMAPGVHRDIPNTTSLGSGVGNLRLLQVQQRCHSEQASNQVHRLDITSNARSMQF
jgi:hypothetical protein